MAQYTYTSLPPNTIRVLHLHPGPPDSPLRGDLAPYPLPRAITTTPASDLPASDYECVSYVWGSDEKPFTILLSDNRPLPITATLDSLLRRLRKLFLLDNGDEDTQTFPVWADAICINQGDEIEKGEQVALMPEIYQGARRVIVDLGEEGDDGDLDDALWLMNASWKKEIWTGVRLGALDGGRMLTPREAGVLLGFEVPCDEEREALEGAQLPKETDPRWDAVARFFSRPWFERLWVVQEFVLAREVVMICGEREIPWRGVVAATTANIGPVLLPAQESTGIMPLFMFRQITFQLMAYQRQAKVLVRTTEGRKVMRSLGRTAGGNPALDLYWLLDTFQAKRATRSRDKYFGLVGMAVDVKGDEPELRPDYVSPLETIVSRVGGWLWQTGRGPQILLTGGIPNQSGIDIPSWVPDFTASSDSSLLSRFSSASELYNAAGDTRFHFTMTPEVDHLVTLSAMCVDVVDRDPFAELPLRKLFLQCLTGREDDRKPSLLLLLRHVAFNIRAVFDDVASLSPVPVELSDEALGSAFGFGFEEASEIVTKREYAIGFRWISWLAAHRDVVDSTADEPFEALNSSLEREFEATADEVEECQHAFLDWVIGGTLRNAQSTRTRRGRVASLPSCFRRGDEIWVVRGVPLPLLFRRSTEYPECYQLVGSCYVHGIMNGEALEEGPRFEQLTLC